MSSAISFHKLALMPLTNGLKNAQYIISKGQAHAEAQGHNQDDYLNASLHPNMKDLVFQIHCITNLAKWVPSHINPENPSLTLPDIERTFTGLISQIQKTIDFLESIDEKSFEGQESREVEVNFPSAEWKNTALDFVIVFNLPNFSFHLVTAYDILRSKGVELVKWDYLNGGQVMGTSVKMLGKK